MGLFFINALCDEIGKRARVPPRWFRKPLAGSIPAVAHKADGSRLRLYLPLWRNGKRNSLRNWVLVGSIPTGGTK